MSTWPRVPGIAFGGDYNPEQWPESVWPEDVALMRAAGVSMVTVGVFSWALLERRAGEFDFGWLDRVFDLLHDAGIAVDLATATASPPPWFSRAHPDTLPVTKDGVRLEPGSRQAYCPSAPAYREAATSLARTLAQRYGTHPALVMWHVNNEYGCHVAQCYCDVSAAAFRRWLEARYGDVEALNAAWATAFWSQHYTDWAEIMPPRSTPTWANPTQQLDWYRFSSAELLACFTSERDAVREVTPDLPITTNFMGTFKPVDYFDWAPHEDVVSNDHYLLGHDPAPHVQLAMSADLVRSAKRGAPWVLMEHSTSAVNWQPRNLAKQPGQLARNSLQHVARGADAVCFFQWRASRAGAEKFHSGMVPHAGTDTKVWREVVDLGAKLKAIAEVAGTRVTADVAILFDWNAWWAAELDSHPSADVQYLPMVRDYYEALWNQGVTVDFVRPDDDLSGYRLVIAPCLYLVTDDAAANIAGYVHGGGHLLCTFFSGIVNQDDAVRLGGYPGAFRDLLGVRVEEFFPLAEGGSVRLSDGATGRDRGPARRRRRGRRHLSRRSARRMAGGDYSAARGRRRAVRHHAARRGVVGANGRALLHGRAGAPPYHRCRGDRGRTTPSRRLELSVRPQPHRAGSRGAGGGARAAHRPRRHRHASRPGRERRRRPRRAGARHDQREVSEACLPSNGNR
jgi:beta-galactosidase